MVNLLQLVLFRPFLAAAMPTITLLNGLAVDAATRDTGHCVIAPLMQWYWDRNTAANASHPQGDVELPYHSSVATVGRQQPHVDGWGLKSVQRMSQVCDMGRTESLGTSCSEQKFPCSSRQDAAGTSQAKEEIGPDGRRAIERRVEAAVARAIEVERRWTELDACWDSVVSEILHEWQSELA